MRFIIVTGMSGAGKSTALKILEDIGYFCVDNLPIELITKFAELAFNPNSETGKVAMGVDIRSGLRLGALEGVFQFMEANQYEYEILFLDASDETLIKRYKETRRTHPLARKNRVDEGLLKERKKLDFLRQRADYIIDTSKLLTKELREELEEVFQLNKEYKNIFITILSFGFKNGIPSDADLIFDVRFMPNPFYDPVLKHKTGNDQEVRTYVMDSPASVEFVQKLNDMIDFLIPNYVKEGKNQLVVGIGCTGGKHRSVTVANHLYEHLEKNETYGLRIEHRDLTKDNHGTNWK